jgi:hypothetical protein
LFLALSELKSSSAVDTSILTVNILQGIVLRCKLQSTYFVMRNSIEELEIAELSNLFSGT